MSKRQLTRRQAVMGLGSATIGVLGLSTLSDSASATLQAEPSYNINDTTRETTSEIESIRLVVDSEISYQSEQEISTLGVVLNVGQKDQALEQLDVSIVQQSMTENAVTQTLEGELTDLVRAADMAESTTEFNSELRVFVESSGTEVAETIVEESFTLTMENGKIESELTVTSEGEIQVSEAA